MSVVGLTTRTNIPYSINSRQSFEMIQTIYDKITDFSGAQNMPTVIVGQKNDLATEQRYVMSPSAMTELIGLGG
jgi:hypothetical protein